MLSKSPRPDAEDVAHASWYVTRMTQKKLHSCILLVRVSKLVLDHFFANVGSTGSRFSSRGCKHTSGGSRGCKDHLWSVMFMNYAEYLRYLARVERGWRVIWSLLTKIDPGNWLLLAVECWIKFSPSSRIPYIIYIAHVTIWIVIVTHAQPPLIDLIAGSGPCIHAMRHWSK